MSEFAVDQSCDVEVERSGALSLLVCWSVGLLADDEHEFSTHVTPLWEDHYTEFHPFYCISW